MVPFALRFVFYRSVKIYLLSIKANAALGIIDAAAIIYGLFEFAKNSKTNMLPFFRKVAQLSWKIEYLAVLPLVGYVIFLSESVFARPNSIWALSLLFWTFGAAFLAWKLVSGKGERLLNRVDYHANTIVLGLIALVSTALITLNILHAHYFAIGLRAEDTAYYNQILWNTIHGNLLSGNLNQARLYDPPVSNDLALHVSPILFGILPIYALFPNFLTLLLIRDVAMAVAAWPLFLLACERMGKAAGVAIVIVFFSNPVVIAQGFQEFSLLQLAPLPFLCAFRAFAQNRFYEFYCSVGVTLSLREDTAIVMCGFGILALVEKREIRWWGPSFVLPVGWWIITTLLIQPAFGRWGNNVFEIAAAGGASASLGIYQPLLENPLQVLNVLQDGGIYYFYRLLRVVSFLAILGYEGLFVVPIFTANIFLAKVFYGGIDPLSHLALLPTCALIAAAVLVVERIGRNYRWNIRVFAIITLLLLPAASLLDGAKDAVQERLALYTVRNDVTILEEALAQIPETASIAAPNYALPALSSRPTLFFLTFLHMYRRATPSYLLLDQNVDRVTRNPELRARYIALLEQISSSQNYETIWARGDYRLLRRKPDSLPS